MVFPPPEGSRGPSRPTADGGVRGDAALAEHDLVDPARPSAPKPRQQAQGGTAEGVTAVFAENHSLNFPVPFDTAVIGRANFLTPGTHSHTLLRLLITNKKH